MRDVGDQIAIRHEVRDPDGVLTAATVTVVVTKPDGTTASPTATATSTGIYDASFLADQPGVWRWTWTVSGAVIDVARGQVDVGDPVPPTYATLTELKAVRRIADTADDVALQSALTVASRAIDSKTGRRFWLDATPSARIYNPYTKVARLTGAGEMLLIDDIGDVTGMMVEIGNSRSGWNAITDAETEPDNAIAKGKAVTGLLRSLVPWVYDPLARVRVTAKWGWPAVPDEINQAALLLANRLYMRKDSPGGVVGGGDFGPVRVSRWDPDVEALVSPYVLPGIA